MTRRENFFSLPWPRPGKKRGDEARNGGVAQETRERERERGFRSSLTAYVSRSLDSTSIKLSVGDVGGELRDCFERNENLNGRVRDPFGRFGREDYLILIRKRNWKRGGKSCWNKS